jgi:HK97 gp10 family phage protein
MATQSIRVEGLSILNKAFQDLSLHMRSKVARRATNAAAQVIKKEASLKAPLGDPVQTPGVPVGNLKQQVMVRRIPPSKTELTSEHIVRVRSGARAYFASRYASIYEFGSVKQPARPFMRPAFDHKRSEAQDALVNAIRDDLNKVNK